MEYIFGFKLHLICNGKEVLLNFTIALGGIIETSNGELKNIAQVEHLRHWSFDSFVVNTLGTL
jgi:hypothetical protein